MQVQTFKTTDEFFDAILGSVQQDRHVQAFRRHHQNIADMAWYDEADERLRKSNEEFIARNRARRAS